MDAEGLQNLSVSIKGKARELGFDLCGIARSRSLDEYKPAFIEWLGSGMNDKMKFLGRDIEKRHNPELLYPGVKSLVVTGINYFSEVKLKDPGTVVISRYAYGSDYHVVIGDKLKKLLFYIKSFLPDADGKVFVDSAPLLEKAWAKEAGLGWQGKHSVVINKEIGSFFFIGIITLNIGLDYDEPFSDDLCGDCRICIDSCPTGAINKNRTVDARKCIANLTIENKEPVPVEMIPLFEGRIFGCDKCQEVCPWNKKAQASDIPEFAINEEVASMTVTEWQSLSRERFEKLFSNSAVGRVKYEKFIHNILTLTKSGS